MLENNGKRSNSLGGSLVWSFMEQGSTKFAGIIIELMLARLLSPDAFGVLAIVTVFVNVFDAMSRNGLNTALIQSSDNSATEYSTAFWLGEGIAAIAYTVVFLISPIMASFYNMPELELFLRVYSLVLFLNAFNSIQRAYLQKTFRFDGTFRVNLVAVVLSGVVGVVSAVYGFGTWSLVFQNLSNALFACVAFRLIVPWTPSLSFSVSSAIHLFSFSWKTSISGILNSLYSGLSNLILGATCSEYQLGLYDRGCRYPQALVAILSGSVSNVMLPLFSRLKHDADAFSSEMKRALRLGTFFIAPFAFFLFVISEPGIRLILGDAWIEATPIFQIASLGFSVGFLQSVNQRALLALGRSDIYLGQEIGKLTLLSVLVFGSAILTKNIYIVALTNYGLLFVNVILFDMNSSRRLIGYGRIDQIKDVVPTFVAAVLSALLTMFVAHFLTNDLVKLAVDIPIFISTYLIISFGLKNPAIPYAQSVLRRIVGSNR